MPKPTIEASTNVDTKFWVALSRVPQLGTVRFRRLEAYFGKLENVWKASHKELKAAGLEDRPTQEILAVGTILLQMMRWLPLNEQR